MTTLQRGDASLWTRGMIAVLIAQFLPAMADNALLFAALALLRRGRRRGHKTVGAGHAIAVQNLVENIMMLLMVGLYTLVVRAGAPIVGLAAGFGAALAASIGVLWILRWRGRPRSLVTDV